MPVIRKRGRHSASRRRARKTASRPSARRERRSKRSKAPALRRRSPLFRGATPQPINYTNNVFRIPTKKNERGKHFYEFTVTFGDGTTRTLYGDNINITKNKTSYEITSKRGTKDLQQHIVTTPPTTVDAQILNVVESVLTENGGEVCFFGNQVGVHIKLGDTYKFTSISRRQGKMFEVRGTFDGARTFRLVASPRMV